MTNPEDTPLTAGTGFMDRELRDAVMGKQLPPLEPETETARRVRWSTAATEAYTGLYALYEELRDSGHAYAWASAYEASGQAGMLLADLRELLNEPTTPPEPTAPGPPCRTTQHCASWGWCHRCDRRAASVIPYIVKAVDAMGVRPDCAGSVYATIMDWLRQAAALGLPTGHVHRDGRCADTEPHPAHPWQPYPGNGLTVGCPGLPQDLHRVRCVLAMQNLPGHKPHVWEPQPGMLDVVCPGPDDPAQEDPCPGP